MQLQAPSGQTVAFGPQTNELAIRSVSFDLQNHTFTIVYGPATGASPAAQKIIRGAIPAALQASLEAHAQSVVEADNGWTAGSSTVVTP